MPTSSVGTAEMESSLKRTDTYMSVGTSATCKTPDICSPETQMVPAPATMSSLKTATEVEVFFLVNPSSGGNQAYSFVASGIQNCRSELVINDITRHITMHFFDMTKGSDGDRPGYHALKKAVEENKTTVACACGGDGSVVWMTSEIEKHGISDDRLFYAVIPYGTGNDFARAFGWEELNALQPFDMTTGLGGKKVMKLNKVLEAWFNSEPCLMDIWDIHLELHDDGEVSQVKGAERKKVAVGNRAFKMFNYFSIGIDARIGVGFDRNRTTSQTRNQMVYMNEGVKKIFKNDFISIDKWIETFEEKGKVILGKDQENATAELLQGTKCFMALNVNSYGGGRQLWEHAHKLGIKIHGNQSTTKLRTCPQQMGDKKLEWATCLHRSSLGFEQVGHGHTRRAYQGRGDFTINMADRRPKDRCYFQVDGEFYQCNRPKCFKVSFDKQVTVLTNFSATFVDEKNLIQSETRKGKGSKAPMST